MSVSEQAFMEQISCVKRRAMNPRQTFFPRLDYGGGRQREDYK